MQTSKFYCFLCREPNLTQPDCRVIEGTSCIASKKPLKAALMYLIRCQEAKLQIPDDGVLCLTCHKELLEYDLAMCKALQKQRILMNLIATATLKWKPQQKEENKKRNISTDCTGIRLFEDALVSDEEIERTVLEVELSELTNNEKKSPAVQTYSQLFKHNFPKSQVTTLPKRKKMFQCPLCAIWLTNKDNLKRHINSVHKKFKCEICEYSHRNKDYVRLHMNIHEGRNENCCVFCYKGFSTKISTIRHMEVHLNNKRYMCDKCGLCFSQTTILYNHRLQHEAEENPLQCDICKNTFKTKRTYRHHMITHREDRPRFGCEYCDKTFTEKYTLKMHRRIHLVKTPSNQCTSEQEQFLNL